MLMKRYLILVFALLALAACGAPESGTVTAKQFEEPRTYIAFNSIPNGQTCYGSGTTQTCTTNHIQVPYTVYDGPDWKIHLVDGDKKGWAYVTQDTYEHIAVGSFYNRKTGAGYLKDPNNHETPHRQH